jgi:AcrR family transcriptional regulator
MATPVVADQQTRLTPSQADRRQRMLAAAAGMVLAGGFDGLAMRDVATTADVALGTLYRYFPSKEYLLVSLMADEVDRLADRLAVYPAVGDDAAQRVSSVLARANRALLRFPAVSEAHVKALVSGNEELAPVVVQITQSMRGIILSAIAGSAHATGDVVVEAELIAIADTLFDVWLAALVGWISGVTQADGVQTKLERTIKLLFPAADD